MPLSSTKIMREMLFVPPSMPALDLLEKMQATRIHLALVVDEYGGTDGLVSMEDIVEQIVGDIADEHDEDELPAVVAPARRIVRRRRAREPRRRHRGGRRRIRRRRCRRGGRHARRLSDDAGRPRCRCAASWCPGPAGFEIEVLDSDPRRIKKVRIHRSKDRPIERDRDGRRRYTPDAATAPAIAPAPEDAKPPPAQPPIPARRAKS